MHDGFNIRKGNYQVPGMGSVSTLQPITDKTAVDLYLNKKFPFITLKPEGVKVLKKANLSPQQVSILLLNAQSLDEIELILKVRSNKILRNVAEVVKAKFKD